MLQRWSRPSRSRSSPMLAKPAVTHQRKLCCLLTDKCSVWFPIGSEDRSGLEKVNFVLTVKRLSAVYIG